eukprot:scaffold3759_cov425-Prasinococcus_capsulatus_cf.AAC.16
MLTLGNHVQHNAMLQFSRFVLIDTVLYRKDQCVKAARHISVSSWKPPYHEAWAHEDNKATDARQH